MRGIAQIFTGGYDAPLYTADTIIARLREITESMTIDKVIVGWYPDEALYRPIGEFLHARGIEMFLWLPVFSETSDLVPMKAAVDLKGEPLTKAIEQQGENFIFSCPSSLDNLKAVCGVYETHFSECGFDGVFLDRIRTQSFVGGVEGVLSCGCADCRAAYAERGVSLDEIAALYEEKGDAFFDVTAFSPSGEMTFADERVARFFDAKGEIVAQSVRILSRYFREGGLKIGLDVYAPLMSRFVGQCYPLLAKEADFIKPMLYRRTKAPAGMMYEYDLFHVCAPTASGYPELTADDALLRAQTTPLAVLPCAVYAGIEVNFNAVIAPTDATYVRESVAVLEECGMDGVTLSWDAMQAPDDHLRAACGI